MKGVIIGSDLLEHNGDVKIIETNTNTTIYNRGAEMLEYDGLFDMLNSNGITEFHFIWTETDAFIPLYEPYKFKEILEQKISKLPSLKINKEIQDLYEFRFNDIEIQKNIE